VTGPVIPEDRVNFEEVIDFKLPLLETSYRDLNVGSHAETAPLRHFVGSTQVGWMITPCSWQSKRTRRCRLDRMEQGMLAVVTILYGNTQVNCCRRWNPEICQFQFYRQWADSGVTVMTVISESWETSRFTSPMTAPMCGLIGFFHWMNRPPNRRRRSTADYFSATDNCGEIHLPMDLERERYLPGGSDDSSTLELVDMAGSTIPRFERTGRPGSEETAFTRWVKHRGPTCLPCCKTRLGDSRHRGKSRVITPEWRRFAGASRFPA